MNETAMRDRLIELITKATTEVTFRTSDGRPVTTYKRSIVDRAEAKDLADHLIANGVILPPVKVGDNLYCVYSPKYPANPDDKGKWFMTECEVARLHYGVKGLSIEMYGFGAVSEKEIGKTVFLTKEEAEKCLKEKENGNL